MPHSPFVLPVFEKFPTEGEIIGRLLVGYGELEIALCRCVAEAVDNLDIVVKKMFRSRGASRRIDKAISIGKSSYKCFGLDELFDEIICEMRHCLEIRNQFAHCNFYEDPDHSGNLKFTNVEELAKQEATIEELISAPARFITQALLNEQATYFVHVWHHFYYLKCEVRVRKGKLTRNPYEFTNVTRPQTHIPS